jgi:hypothetical protein
MESDQTTPGDAVGGKAAYEQRKQEKMRAKVTTGETKSHTMGRRLGWIGASVLALALIGYGIFVFIKNSTPQQSDRSAAIPILAASHIPVGAAHDAYNSNPPTSGPHYEVPAKPGFREQPIADEHLVHSLEHGLIWISYNPRVAGAVKEKLRALATPWTVITERAANDTDIAVAAWGRLDAFNLDSGTFSQVDEERVKDFVKRYSNRGPEKIPTGQHGGI